MKPAPFEYHRPATLDEALAILAADEDAKPLAGGQSLVPMLNFRLARPSALVDLSGLGLDGIRLEDGALVVGAMTRQWDLEHHADAYPLLRDALRHVGHTATRCRGTVGGSLVHADPTAELPVCALALGAELRTNRRTIPAEEFFVSVFTTALEPGELLVEIRFPEPVGRDVVPGGRAPRRRLRGRLRRAKRRPGRGRRRRRDAGALGRRRARPGRRPLRARRLQARDRREAGRAVIPCASP